jgi:hypothetical protein
MGALLHVWSGIVVASGTCVAAIFAPAAFTGSAPATEVVVVALLSAAGMLALLERWLHLRAARYVAGGLAALAVTWQLRYFGAENLQAFVLAPGSYVLLIGVLLPGDERLGHPLRAGQICSLLGSLILLVPTLAQSFATEPNWVYALALALEALVLVGLGVGTHSRFLVLAGSVFVGIAALRGAALAVNSGVPVALVIGVLALLLMGGATWLSLRARREASETP